MLCSRVLRMRREFVSHTQKDFVFLKKNNPSKLKMLPMTPLRQKNSQTYEIQTVVHCPLRLSHGHVCAECLIVNSLVDISG